MRPFVVIVIAILLGVSCMKEKLDKQTRTLLQDTERFNTKEGESGWSVSRVIIDSMDLSGLRLFGSSIETADWKEMRVSDGLIRNSTFEDVNFSRAEFKKTKFVNVEFIDCSFQQSTFEGGALVNTTFEGGESQRMEFKDVVFEGGGFSQFDDQKGTFKESRLDNTRFAEVKFSDSAFYNGGMSEVIFIDSEIEGGTFHEVEMNGVRLTNTRIENTGFAKVAGAVRFKQCRSEDGFSFGGGDGLDVRFDQCGDLNFVTLADAHLDTISFKGTTAFQTALYNASVNSLRIRNSELEYLNLEADSISGSIKGGAVTGLNFMDSKVNNFSLESVTLRDYIVVDSASFSNLSLQKITYRSPFEIRGRESVIYEKSDKFE